MIEHFDTIEKYNEYFHFNRPKKDLIDVVNYDDCSDLRLNCPGITSDFYLMAFKRNMTDPEWYGNTELDPKSAYMYFIGPRQLHRCRVEREWNGYHILISPVLLQEYNIQFSFFNYEMNEALFLTKEEQERIETLYRQIYDEYCKDDYSMSLLMAYCNLFMTYVDKCYKRQFFTREPLYNKLVVEFKKMLNEVFSKPLNELPSVNYFADRLNLSPNYFSDVIKHQTGHSAMETIHEKIVNVAKYKLRNTDFPISEIAYELGFDYPTYFGRMFKKETGQTPSEFRNIKNKA